MLIPKVGSLELVSAVSSARRLLEAAFLPVVLMGRWEAEETVVSVSVMHMNPYVRGEVDCRDLTGILYFKK